MRLMLACVGRLKVGAERDLCAKYMQRASAAGRGVGFAEIVEREIAEGKAARVEDRRAAEALGLRQLRPRAARIIALDERGKSFTSAAFARDLGEARDAGVPTCMIVVGGPDGLDPAFLAEADLTLSLGAMTWPHQLARVLAAEQIYRATTILGGHPYHRA